MRESAEWEYLPGAVLRPGRLSWASELPNLIKSSFLNAARESSLECYLKILEALAGHGKTLAEIAGATGIQQQ